jgi:hypothetical protein
MLRKLLLAIVGAMMFLPIGCSTTEPVMWSWPHHKRRLQKILHDFHMVHMDIDRIIFDMEEYPVEEEH